VDQVAPDEDCILLVPLPWMAGADDEGQGTRGKESVNHRCVDQTGSFFYPSTARNARCEIPDKRNPKRAVCWISGLSASRISTL